MRALHLGPFIVAGRTRGAIGRTSSVGRRDKGVVVLRGRMGLVKLKRRS
jgi:hypothetical protein